MQTPGPHNRAPQRRWPGLGCCRGLWSVALSAAWGEKETPGGRSYLFFGAPEPCPLQNSVSPPPTNGGRARAQSPAATSQHRDVSWPQGSSEPRKTDSPRPCVARSGFSVSPHRLVLQGADGQQLRGTALADASSSSASPGTPAVQSWGTPAGRPSPLPTHNLKVPSGLPGGTLLTYSKPSAKQDEN